MFSKFEICQKLKSLRSSNNLKVSQVVDLLIPYGISVSAKTIYGWESGHRQPDADTLLALCDIYNVSDILSEFRDTSPSSLTLSEHEKKVITAYRNNPNLQYAVDKMLDVSQDPIPNAKSNSSDIQHTLDFIANDANQLMERLGTKQK